MNVPNANDWSIAEVCEWANYNRYSQDTIKCLIHNEIDGRILLTLSSRDLRDEIEIKSLSERKRLFNDISVLRGYANVCEGRNKNDYLSVKSYMELLGTRKYMEEDDDDFIIAEREQFNELISYERSISDLKKAAKLQGNFNYYQLQEEEDAKLARQLNNLDDTTALSRLDTESRKLVNNEEKRQSDNQRAIDLISHEPKRLCEGQVSFDFQNTPIRVQGDICIVCDSITVDSHSVTLICGHVYCDTCIAEWFERAVNDLSFVPLQCCKQRIHDPEILVQKYLEKFKAEKLITAMEEKECQNKMYCPNSSCSIFINLDKVEEYLGFDMNFVCRRCKTSICYSCHSLKHDLSTTCEQNRLNIELQDSRTIAEFKRFGYQQCNSCKNYVELMYGCNHMTCSCRHEFCYNCGADWKPRRCDCVLVDMGRLRNDEDANINANIVGDERARLLHERVNVARGMMYAEEACNHQMRRTDEYTFRKNKPKCQTCNRRLNHFGYYCRCGQKKCIGCHLNT